MTTMTVKIGHKDYGFTSKVFHQGVDITPDFLPSVPQTVELSSMTKAEIVVDKTFRNVLVPASLGISYLNLGLSAFAASADIAMRLTPLITIVQNLALPVGIVVASWGLIEIIMGNYPQGKEKIKYSLIGFIGMFIIPEVFYAIRDAFQSHGAVSVPPSTEVTGGTK